MTVIDSISPKSDTMFWCTCAERDQVKYMERVQLWNMQLDKLGVDGDRFVFIDGKLNMDVEGDPTFHDINFISAGKFLGRASVSVFPGWKRNLYLAMCVARNYKYCTHIESDCYIANKDGFLPLIRIDNIIASTYCRRYNFVEPIAFVFNNSEFREELIEHYSWVVPLYEPDLFETVLQKCIQLYKDNYINFGNSLRLESGAEYVSGFDVYGQVNAQLFYDLLRNNYKETKSNAE